MHCCRLVLHLLSRSNCYLEEKVKVGVFSGQPAACDERNRYLGSVGSAKLVYDCRLRSYSPHRMSVHAIICFRVRVGLGRPSTDCLSTTSRKFYEIPTICTTALLFPFVKFRYSADKRGVCVRCLSLSPPPSLSGAIHMHAALTFYLLSSPDFLPDDRMCAAGGVFRAGRTHFSLI